MDPLWSHDKQSWQSAVNTSCQSFPGSVKRLSSCYNPIKRIRNKSLKAQSHSSRHASNTLIMYAQKLTESQRKFHTTITFGFSPSAGSSSLSGCGALICFTTRNTACLKSVEQRSPAAKWTVQSLVRTLCTVLCFLIVYGLPYKWKSFLCRRSYFGRQLSFPWLK